MPYCCACNDRYFVNYAALNQHRANSVQHNFCFRCDEDFESLYELDNHNEDVHDICRFCDEEFDDSYDLREHREEEHVFLHCCDFWVSNLSVANRHKSNFHHWCESCDRFFTSLNGLRNHLASSAHQPKAFTCPVGPRCGKKYVSPSAVVLHLESGTCPSGFNRQIIDEYIARHDVRNVITNPQRMIAGSSGGNGGGKLAPIPSYTAGSQAWNGSAFECYFCPATFPYIAQLNQHLNSPKHARRQGNGRLYRCPGPGCSAQAETLSGLAQHIESGKCGIKKDPVVQSTMNSFTEGMGRLRLT